MEKIDYKKKLEHLYQASAKSVVQVGLPALNFLTVDGDGDPGAGREGQAVEKVHRFIDASGERTGRHHEIYLSDIRRADFAKWKTIIRQPMRSGT